MHPHTRTQFLSLLCNAKRKKLSKERENVLTKYCHYIQPKVRKLVTSFLKQCSPCYCFIK